MLRKPITGGIILLFLLSSLIPIVTIDSSTLNNIIYVDDGGAESDWETLEVSMSKNKFESDRINDSTSNSIWFIRGLFRYLDDDEEYIYLKAISAKLRGFGNGVSICRLSFCKVKVSKPFYGFLIKRPTILPRLGIGICREWDYLEPESTPNIQFVMDDLNDKLTVVSADPSDIPWADIEINGTCDTSDLGTYVTVGDTITSCSGTITIRYIPTDTLLGIWEFSEQMVLIFGSSGDARRLDPADVTDGRSIQRMDNIFESLVEFKPGTTEIQPCLATSWDVSEDGLDITFSLRDDVIFHDGTNFDADAVVFSFERQYNTSHPYHQYGEWAYWGYMFSDIDRVEKIDDYTVKIVLKKPNAAMITSLAMFTVAIVSPTNAEKWGEDAFKHPIGTGPFKFVEWVKDDHITLEANNDYWRERPKLDRLIFRVIEDPSARLLAIIANEIQGMEYPSPASFDTIEANPDLQLLTEPGMNIGYLALNTGYGYYDDNENGVRDPDEPWVETPGYSEPLANKSVRQAINHAIDKSSIVENLYKGTAIVAKNGMPPFMLGYNDEIVDYPYDHDKAKELLEEAGYPNGFNTTLWVMPVSRPYMFDPSKIGEAIQGYLAAVNITVDIYQVDWATYLEKTEAGEHPMCLLGWSGDNGDPDNFMNVLYGANACSIGTAGNVAFYNKTEVQDLFSAALQTYDTAERAELYEEAQVIIHEDAPFVYLAHANQNIVFRSNVKGYVLNPTARMFFYPVEIE